MPGPNHPASDVEFSYSQWARGPENIKNQDLRQTIGGSKLGVYQQRFPCESEKALSGLAKTQQNWYFSSANVGLYCIWYLWSHGAWLIVHDLLALWKYPLGFLLQVYVAHWQSLLISCFGPIDTWRGCALLCRVLFCSLPDQLLRDYLPWSPLVLFRELPMLKVPIFPKRYPLQYHRVPLFQTQPLSVI